MHHCRPVLAAVLVAQLTAGCSVVGFMGGNAHAAAAAPPAVAPSRLATLERGTAVLVSLQAGGVVEGQFGGLQHSATGGETVLVLQVADRAPARRKHEMQIAVSDIASVKPCRSGVPAATAGATGLVLDVLAGLMIALIAGSK